MPWAKNTRELDNEIDFAEEVDLSDIQAALNESPAPKSILQDHSSPASQSFQVPTKDLATLIQKAVPNFNERVKNSIEALDDHGLNDDRIAKEMVKLLDSEDSPYITRYKVLELAVRMRGGMMRRDGERNVGGIHIHVGGGTDIASILMPQIARANPQTIEVKPLQSEIDEQEKIA